MGLRRPEICAPVAPHDDYVDLKFIGAELQREHLASCPTKTKDLGEIFRLEHKQQVRGALRARAEGILLN